MSNTLLTMAPINDWSTKTTKEIAEMIRELRGLSVAPKPKDKATAIRMLEKELAGSKVAPIATIEEVPSEAEVAKIEEMKAEFVELEAKVDEAIVSIEEVAPIVIEAAVEPIVVSTEIAKIVRKKSETRTELIAHPGGAASFDAKTFVLLYDGSAEHEAILLEFSLQAQLVIRAWHRSKETTISGLRLQEVVDKDGPRAVRSSKLVIQRYMTYFVRKGLVSR